MNRIYRLCWNVATCQWVAASELARNSRPAIAGSSLSRAPRLATIAVAVSLALGATGAAHAGQTGGQVSAGIGTIRQDGATTTINQTSQRLSLNWQTFDIGANETVNFVQPGSDAIAVNRILGNKPSDIYGHLNANGQVWLINPNGVLFGEGAQVNVGGLVASTLDTSDDSLTSNTRTFSGNGKGSVVNKGSLRAANGGYIALLGNSVSNQGTISAQLGTVAMGGGSAVTLTFDGSRLMHLQVDRSTLDNLVENRQLVQADGGRVFMTAGAADSLLASTVNNTGVVRAQTVENHNGQIVLLGGMKAGHVNVEGTLDASAPNGGDGGTIETSGAYAHIGAAAITASAPKGKAGTWLVDPFDLTIDATAAGTISDTLNTGTNVTEQTTATGASGAGTLDANGVGDIHVNAPITWTNAAATLTLDAYRAIDVNAAINGAGGVLLRANGNGGNGNITLGAGGTITAGNGITLSATGAFVNQAGANALTATSGRWLVYSATPTGNTLGGLTPGFIQYKLAAGAAPTAAGAGLNGFLYAATPTVTVSSLTGTVTKTYDATTGGALLTDSNLVRTGFLNGDKFATVGTGTFASKDAASNIAVTMNGTAANYTFTDATGAIPVYGYTLAGLNKSGNIGTINPRQLTVDIVNNPTKTYNGTTTATLTSSNYVMNGLQGSESITFAQPNTVGYDSADAGARTVNASFVDSNFVAANGTSFSNYILPTSATGAGTINKAKVQLSGLIGTDKTYDGSTNDAIDKSGATIFGVITADQSNVTLDSSAGTGTFADANVGNKKTVTATGFLLTGSKKDNYELVGPADIRATIGAKTLTLSNITASGKVYDATTLATLGYTGATLVGVVSADSANVGFSTASATGRFATKNVGTGIAVTSSGFTLTGSGASNYTLAQPTGLSANITAAPLTVTITGNPTRVYNGTSNTSLTSGQVTVTGWQGSENGAVVQSSSAVYDSGDAGTRVVSAHIEASDFSLANGTSLSNYTYSNDITGLGTIEKAPLTWQIVGNPSKTYDGNTAATLNSGNYQVYGFVSGESATVSKTQGTYATADAGVRGVTAIVTPGDFVAANGTNLANYTLPTSITGYGFIYQADGSKVTVTITGRPTRAYNGTDVATLTSSDYTVTTAGGFPDGEGFTISKTSGTYASKNAGVQPVTVYLTQSDYVPVGSTNPANYTPFATVAYGTGEITRAILTASIVGNPTKVYNGTTYIALNPSNYQIDGFALDEGADIVPSKAIAFDDKNVGTGKTITAQMATTSYTAHANTDLQNYVLADTATGPGTITQAPLYILGVSALNKVYDTTTAATLNSGSARLVGLVGADTGNVTLVKSTTGTFDSENAGTRNVTASGFSITGSEYTNYALQQPTGLSATITPYTLNISGVKTVNKDYDGTTLIALDNSGAVLDPVLSGDEGKVDLSGGSAVGNTRAANAATGLAVTTAGYGLTGDRAGNYQVNQVSGLTATINRKALAATIIGNPIKPYDGSTSVTLTASDYRLDGFATGEGATVPQSSTAAYLSKNAGVDVGLTSTLSVSDFVATGSTNLANYILPTGATGTRGQITPFIIKLTGARQYNGSTTVDATLFTSTGKINGVNGEKITLGNYATMASKNVGTNTLSDVSTFTLGNDTGLAQNYSVIGSVAISKAPLSLDPTGTSVADHVYDGLLNAVVTPGNFVGKYGSDALILNNGTTGTFTNKNVGNGIGVTNTMSVTGADAMNYTFTAPTLKGNITPKYITVTATGIDKVYDGSRDATVNLESGGKVGSDDLTYGYGGALFDTKDVGTDKAVAVTGLVLNGTANNNYRLVTTTADTTADVTQRAISFDGTRVYNTGTGVDATMVTNYTALSGGVAGETLTLGGTGTIASKNVGTYTAGNANGLDLSSFTLTGNGGTLASNYTFTGGTQVFHVTPYGVTVGATGVNRVYDATTGATVNLTQPTLLGSDVANFVYDSAAFDNKNVGEGKRVDVTGIHATGTDAGNYAYSTTAVTSANITPLAITGTITATDKVYDGQTTATTTGTLAGVKGSDDIGYTSTSGTFSDKNAGGGKIVTVDGSIGGTDAGNYIVTDNDTTTAAIAKLGILVGATAADKMYDALATATVTGLTPTGYVAGDHIAFTATGGAFDDANAATGKHVTVSGIAGSGDDIGNYTWNSVANTTATISPYIIALQGTRVYDGGTTVAASAFASDFQIDGINGDTLTLSGAGSVGDKNVDTQKQLTSIGTLGLQGNGSALSTNYTLVGGDHRVDITPKQIVVDAAGSTKVYDANTLATATLSSAGVVSGDQLDFTAAHTLYDTKNVGTGKTVTATGIVASGTDAANYAINTTAVTTGDITPLAITGTIGATSKTYDGTTVAQTQGSLTGVLAGDTLGVATQGTFDGKDAANGRTVNVGASLTGIDAGNYTLTTNATTTADIRKVVLDLTGTRVYDGTAIAGAAMFGNQGVVAGIAGESLTLSGAGVLASKNVATGRDLSGLGTLSLTGNASTLATNYTLLGGHDVATVTPLGINAGIAADDKIYDGNTSAVTHGTLSGVLSGDDVGLATTGHFVDKNAGNGKTVTVAGSIAGTDAANYALTFNPVTTASIGKRQIVVTSTGTDKFFDGNRADLAVLGTDGVLPGDVVNFVAASALFADPSIGLHKAVSVSGIDALGVDAGNYVFNTSADTTASINQNPSQGASATALTQMDAVLNPDSIATPYGVAASLTVGQYSGNHKKTRQPVEKNAQRADFVPGLSLQVVEGGVRAPADAMH